MLPKTKGLQPESSSTLLHNSLQQAVPLNPAKHKNLRNSLKIPFYMAMGEIAFILNNTFLQWKDWLIPNPK